MFVSLSIMTMDGTFSRKHRLEVCTQRSHRSGWACLIAFGIRLLMCIHGPSYSVRVLGVKAPQRCHHHIWHSDYSSVVPRWRWFVREVRVRGLKICTALAYDSTSMSNCEIIVSRAYQALPSPKVSDRNSEQPGCWMLDD